MQLKKKDDSKDAIIVDKVDTEAEKIKRTLKNCKRLPYYLDPSNIFFPVDLTVLAISLTELFRANKVKLLDLNVTEEELRRLIKQYYRGASVGTIKRTFSLLEGHNTFKKDISQRLERNYFRSI